MNIFLKLKFDPDVRNLSLPGHRLGLRLGLTPETPETQGGSVSSFFRY